MESAQRVTQSTCAHVCATMSQGRAIRDRFNSISREWSCWLLQTLSVAITNVCTLNMNLSCCRPTANKLSLQDKSFFVGNVIVAVPNFCWFTQGFIFELNIAFDSKIDDRNFSRMRNFPREILLFFTMENYKSRLIIFWKNYYSHSSPCSPPFLWCHACLTILMSGH